MSNRLVLAHAIEDPASSAAGVCPIMLAPGHLRQSSGHG